MDATRGLLVRPALYTTVQYGELTAVYDRLEATASTLEKTEILAETFADAGDLLPELSLLARGRLFAAWEPDELGVSSSLTVEAIATASGLPDERIEEWWREEGDLGDAAALAVENRVQATLVSDSLDVREVYETLRGLADHEGAGSQDRRVGEIAGLLGDSDPDEARYIVRTTVGAMRLGVGEGTIRDALAAAFLDGEEDAARAVERAYEVTNDFRTVSETAREAGREGLGELEIELFRPIKAMLARKADGLEDALGGTERPVVEYKYDGMRTKIHVREGEVRLFTRRLEDVTAQFPDVVGAVEKEVGSDRAIIEAEVVGYDNGTPIPFQEFSKRIKRKEEITELAERYPVTVHAFDLLYDDGSLLESPLVERLDRLTEVLEPEGTVRRAENVRPDSLEAAKTFYEDALAAGQEGVVVKNPEAPYRPGSRVGYMRKVKPTMERLDLVVVGAKWSEGRKSDWLGRLRLACFDDERGELREVGRLFSGLTDDELREITAKLEPLVESAEGRAVTVRPEVVIEVEYEEIQASETYDSGYALRFPRFSGFREDLGPEDADGFERVRELYDDQHRTEGA